MSRTGPFTLGQSDHLGLQVCSHATDLIEVTIPSNSIDPLPIGSLFFVHRLGVGEVSFVRHATDLPILQSPIGSNLTAVYLRLQFGTATHRNATPTVGFWSGNVDMIVLDSPTRVTLGPALRSRVRGAVIGGVATLDLSRPFGTVAGDLLVAVVSHLNQLSSATTPTGWTLHETAVSTGTDQNVRHQLFSRVADLTAVTSRPGPVTTSSSMTVRIWRVLNTTGVGRHRR